MQDSADVDEPSTGPDQSTIRVLLIDDDPMVLTTLQSYVAGAPDIEVSGTGEDGSQARELVARLHPDLVIMDIQMPVMSGIEATTQLLREYPGLRIVLLTTFDEDEFLLEALDAGAAGFLLKNTSPQELVRAIRRAHSGNRVVSPGPTDRLIDNYLLRGSGGSGSSDIGLSGREHEVLELLCRGRSNSQIADELFVAETTVKTHVSSIMRKMHVSSRLEVVVYAYEHRLVR